MSSTMWTLNDPHEGAIALHLRGWIRNLQSAPARAVRNNAFLRLTMESGMEVDTVGTISRCSMAAVSYTTNVGDKPLCMSTTISSVSIRDGWDMDCYMWELRKGGVRVATLCYHCAEAIRRAKDSGELSKEDIQGTYLVYLGDEIDAWNSRSRPNAPRRDTVKYVTRLTDSQVYAWMRQRNAGAKESRSPHETREEVYEVAAK